MQRRPSSFSRDAPAERSYWPDALARGPRRRAAKHARRSSALADFNGTTTQRNKKYPITATNRIPTATATQIRGLSLTQPHHLLRSSPATSSSTFPTAGP
jgi:hypothetical protein